MLPTWRGLLLRHLDRHKRHLSEVQRVASHHLCPLHHGPRGARAIRAHRARRWSGSLDKEGLDLQQRAQPLRCHRRAAAEHKIGVAAVHRPLNSLTAAGLVTRHASRGGKARYERVGVAPHAHLIDIRSGRIIEVGDQEFNVLLERTANALGYRLTGYRLDLFGVVE